MWDLPCLLRTWSWHSAPWWQAVATFHSPRNRMITSTTKYIEIVPISLYRVDFPGIMSLTLAIWLSISILKLFLLLFITQKTDRLTHRFLQGTHITCGSLTKPTMQRCMHPPTFTNSHWKWQHTATSQWTLAVNNIKQYTVFSLISAPTPLSAPPSRTM